jgi:hypothetical protein
MAMKTLVNLTVVLVAVAAVGCGGDPLHAGGDGGGAGQGGTGVMSGTAGSGGTVVTSGAAGSGGGSCLNLDEGSCLARPDCLAQKCPYCNGQTHVFCWPMAGAVPPACPPPPCPPTCNGLDETSCKARTDCNPGYCPNCMGGQTFEGCFGPNEGVACALGCPEPASCSGLDEASCNATPGCASQKCSLCGGTPAFSACYRTGTAPPVCLQAPCPFKPPCGGLDEMTCNARSDCQAEYCNECQGRAFVGCGAPGAGFGCPATTCVQSIPCTSLTDQVSCDARTDCHSVFSKCQTCDCLPAGCAVRFSGCADGAKADCSGPKGVGTSFCMVKAPDCASPTTSYVASYSATCYEGCVPPAECGP